MLTTREAAAILNVTPRRIVKLIHASRLQAWKHGRDWWLTEEAIAAYEPHPNGRRGGRPAARTS